MEGKKLEPREVGAVLWYKNCRVREDRLKGLKVDQKFAKLQLKFGDKPFFVVLFDWISLMYIVHRSFI